MTRSPTLRRKFVVLLPDLLEEIMTHIAVTSQDPISDVKNLRRVCKVSYEASKTKKVGKYLAVYKGLHYQLWSDKMSFLRFLTLCAHSGNLQARFILALEHIFNSGEETLGWRHLRLAAKEGHLTAAYLLGLIRLSNPTQLSDGIHLLNKISSGNFSEDHAVVECTVSGNPHIESCRKEALEVLQAITLRNRWIEPKLSCGKQFCGRVIAGSDQWVDPGFEQKNFCSQLCRWRDEYHLLFGKKLMWPVTNIN